MGEGAASFDVVFGYNGAYGVMAHGLVPATIVTGVVPVASRRVVYEYDLSNVAVFRIAIPRESFLNQMTTGGIDLDIVRDPLWLKYLVSLRCH